VAAFFDVDNTLIPGSAIEIRFFRHLWKRGHVGPREMLNSLGFLLQRMPPLSVHPLRERKLYLTGKRPSVIEPLAEEFVRSEVCPRLATDALDALEQHRRAGHILVLVTGSPDFLVAPLAAFLNVEAVLAATLERAGDQYTGVIQPPLPYGEGKFRLIEAFAKQQGVDLARSYAYGDSPGDIETLRSVGYPQVVNPIRGMGRVARRHGWPITKWA
jgi:HAD superfamily hydrolase (TIGR01490 family)